MTQNGKVLLVIVLICLSVCSGARYGQYSVRNKDGNSYQALRMPDGNDWIAENIKTDVPGSFCYEGVKVNCDRYGRLYTWEAAMNVCSDLGPGWRLPTSEDWRVLAKQYGGV